jgi:hypothetical protein
MSSAVIMGMVAVVMITLRWRLLVSYAPIQHGLSHSRNRAVSEGNYTRISSRHCGCRPYYGALGADSPVTISSLQPMQIAEL